MRSLSADFTRNAPRPASTSRVHRSAARARMAPSSRSSGPRTSAGLAPFKNTRSMIWLRKIICATVAAAERTPSATDAPTKSRAESTCRKSSPSKDERPEGLIPIVLQAHLAAEETVDEDEVDGGEHHADAPPDQADREAVGRAGSVMDGQAVLRLHGGQDVGVDGEDGGSHHARYVGSGGEEGGPIAPPEAEVPHEDKARDGEGGEDEAPRVLIEAGEHPGTQRERCGGGNRRQDHHRQPADPGGAPGAGVERSLGLDGNPACAVEYEGSKREDPREHRVPVEDAGLRVRGAEVRPEGLKEVAIFPDGDATHHVAKSSSVEYREEGTPDEEGPIPEGGPHGALYVTSQLHGEAPDHQEPQHDDERQIEAGETRGVQQWEGEKEGASCGDDPDLVAVPHGAYGPQDEAPLGVVPGHERAYGPCAEVEAVEEHVHGEHEGDQYEPQRLHVTLSSFSGQTLARGRLLGLRSVGHLAHHEHEVEEAHDEVHPRKSYEREEHVARGDQGRRSLGSAQ